VPSSSTDSAAKRFHWYVFIHFIITRHNLWPIYSLDSAERKYVVLSRGYELLTTLLHCRHPGIYPLSQLTKAFVARLGHSRFEKRPSSLAVVAFLLSVNDGVNNSQQGGPSSQEPGEEEIDLEPFRSTNSAGYRGVRWHGGTQRYTKLISV